MQVALKNLRQIFQESVTSVRPENLFRDGTKYNFNPKVVGQSSILINGKLYNIENKRCHIVGFGKAVLGMAAKLHAELYPQISGGILSVPIGAVAQFQLKHQLNLHKLRVYEGALNNLPDEAAQETALLIKNYVSELCADDILFVLITGGGSALLPLPRPPLTMSEKKYIVKSLSTKGADIVEMNTVRVALSDIKGGRLAVAANKCSMIFTFVLSDVLGDPVDLIASGPTCEPVPRQTTAVKVLEKYDVWMELPQNVKKMLETPQPAWKTSPPQQNKLFVVGNNKLATSTAEAKAAELDYSAICLSTEVQGGVEEVVTLYKKLIAAIIDYREQRDEKALKNNFSFDMTLFKDFVEKLNTSWEKKRPFLLIFGGEPTVEVKGRGKGGRNQELALRMSLMFYQNEKFKDLIFFSAGTDGIDGPTPSAGAIASASVIVDFLSNNETNTIEDIQKYLANNDTYNFYKTLRSGWYHINTGHTGTNVADLHFLLFPSGGDFK